MICTKNRIIGELKEKSLHQYLKCYFEENKAFHEVSVCPYVADILKGNEITEIQTGAFNKLREKLDYYFTKGYEVNVVYPISEVKYLDIDTISGVKRRKSPKRGTIYDSIKELYKIKTHLKCKNLSITLVFMDILEKRIENLDSHKGFNKVEAYPLTVNSTVSLKKISDYSLFVSDLGNEFTSSDLSKKKKIRKNVASLTLTILKYLGVVEILKKEGRTYIYKKVSKN